MGYRLSFLSIAIVGFTALGCSGGAGAAKDASGTAVTSATLPTTHLTTLDNTTTELASTLRGRVAVVSLWATWCEACVAEFDALNRLETYAQTSGAVVVAVAVGESRADVAAFLATRGLRYVQLVDEEFKLADALGQRQVPATLVVDRRGRVRHVGGAFDARALAAFREALRDPG